MSISEECETLGFLLLSVANLAEEAKTNASNLASCSLHEVGLSASQILSSCDSAQKFFQDGQNQVVVIQSLIGQSSGAAQPKNSGDVFPGKELTPKDIQAAVDKAIDGIQDLIKNAVGLAKTGVAGAVIIPGMLSGLMNTYNDVISPLLDINDKVISGIMPESVFSEIADTLDDAKEQALGSEVGSYEDLQVIQDQENKKKKKQGEVNKPSIGSSPK
jgi:hypothetical protein